MLIAKIALQKKIIRIDHFNFEKKYFFLTISFLVIVALLATGCSGMRESVQNIPKTLIPKDQARIILKRAPANKSATDSLYSGFSARVSFNGKEIGELAPGDIFFKDVNKGPLNIAIDNKAMPGNYSVSLNANPNTEYKFDISARAESNAPGKLFGIFDLNTYKKNNKNTGLFKIVKAVAKRLGKVNSVLPAGSENKQKSIIKSKSLLPPTKVVPNQKLTIKSKSVQTPIKAAPKQKLEIQPKSVSTPVKANVKRKPIIKPKSTISPLQKRLIELKKLLDEELITQKDYEFKKLEVLKGL